MKITEKFCTKNQCYQVGKAFTPKGFMLHSVGCNQPSAVVFANKFNTYQPDGRQICVHGFIGAICGEVVQTLPWTMRGWHGGSGSKGSVNDTHIGIEMCEPACIKYTQGANFTCSDLTTAQKNCETAYNSAVELFAYLCKKFGFDPLADGVIISHYEGNCRGIASNHADPEHLWRGLGMSYTMDGFRKDVATAIGAADKPPDTAKYYVQVGAFAVKANAEAKLAEVKKAYPGSFIKTVGNMFYVQVGAFANKDNAAAYLSTVKETYPDAFVKTF